MRSIPFALLVLSLAAAGCGDGSSSAPSVSTSMEEATVTGMVSVRGKPPVKAEITYDPTNSARKVLPRTAKVDEKGFYTITTLVGQNSVTVHSRAIDADPILSTLGKDVDVKSGENSIPIELP